MGEVHSKTSCQSGFSILETLIAVAVLSVSLMGMAQLIGLAVQQSALARYSTSAISIARSKVEQLRADYNQQLMSGTESASLADGHHGPEQRIIQSGSDHVSNRSLSIRWTVESSGPRKDVVVSVIPTGGSSHATLRSKPVQIAYSLLP